AFGNGIAVFAARPKHGFLRLGEATALLAFQFGDGLVGLVLPLVAQPLVEHQRQDVVLVILPGGLAAQDVGRAPQMGFELLLCQLRGLSLSTALFLPCRFERRLDRRGYPRIHPESPASLRSATIATRRAGAHPRCAGMRTRNSALSLAKFRAFAARIQTN